MRLLCTFLHAIRRPRSLSSGGIARMRPDLTAGSTLARLFQASPLQFRLHNFGSHSETISRFCLTPVPQQPGKVYRAFRDTVRSLTARHRHLRMDPGRMIPASGGRIPQKFGFSAGLQPLTIPRLNTLRKTVIGSWPQGMDCPDTWTVRTHRANSRFLTETPPVQTCNFRWDQRRWHIELL